ncbi:MAG: TonB-dependent receptor [Bacteroidetes bacterium]|nr:TonB-dependent receptor [Bacteroidota bacterium]
MKRILFLSTIFFLFEDIKAQTLKIQDQATLQPLSGAIIKSESGRVQTISNEKGEAALGDLLLDEPARLMIDAPGYRPFTYTLDGAEPGSIIIINLKERIQNLDEVVVSVSKFAEQAKDVPQQVMSLSGKSMQWANQANMAEVLQNSGQIMVQKSQAGGGSPILRGFEANKVLLVVDGVRMNNAIYRGGHLQNVITLDNAILDKAEAVFGPASVVYGSDALGGVLNFYTKNPTLGSGKSPLVKTNLLARYSSAFREKTGHVDINFGWKKLASLTSFTYGDFGDLRQGSVRSPFAPDFGKRPFTVGSENGYDSAYTNNNENLQTKSGYKQYDFLQKILFQQSKSVSHLLNVQYSTTNDIPRYDRLAQVRNGKPRFAEWYYGPANRLLAAYTLGLKGSSVYDEGRVTLAYQDIEESRHDRGFHKNSLENRFENVTVYSLNADFEKRIKQHELRYGAEYNYNNVQSHAHATNISNGAQSPLDTRYPVGGSQMQNIGLYATHTWEISPKFILTEGLRFSNVRLWADLSDKSFFPFPVNNITQNNAALSGNLGFVYLPGNDWRISFLGSTGFRAPNVDDLAKIFESVKGDTLGSGSTIGTVIMPNAKLKPEYTYNAEMTLAKTFDKAITLSATGYYTWYQNAITTQNTSFNGQAYIPYGDTMALVQQNVNAGSAYIYGISGSLKADITDNFSIVSSVNYTYGRLRTDTTDYPLDHIPPVFGQTSFLLNLKQFKSEFFVRYNGWKRLEDYNLYGEDNYAQATTEGMPSWYTLNLRTAWQINKNLQAQVALENILDQNYRVFASGISAPGRNLILSLRANF